MGAGILVGNRGPKDALSDVTQRYLFGFWTLVDQILNAVLFLLIGLEVLLVRYEASILPLALAARFASTIVPVTLLRRHYDFVRGTVIVLVWGGLRGGISIALALSLPETPFKAALLEASYAVLIFTIVVQGLTLGKVATPALRASNA